MEFDWVYLPNFIRGLLLFVLAAALLVVRPGNRLHQALATFLALRAVMRMLSVLGGDMRWAVDSAAVYFLIGTSLTGIWFGLLFWESHGATGGRVHGWTRWALLATGAITMIAYLQAERSPAVLFAWLNVLVPLMNLTLAGIGLMSILIAIRTPLGVHRRSLAILGAAFLLEPAFRSVQLGESMWRAYQTFGGGPLLFASFGYLATFLCVMAGIVALATLLGRPIIALVAGTSALSGLAPQTLGHVIAGDAWLATLLSIHAVWSLTSSGMLIYALLHSKVFFIDVGLKQAGRQTTIIVAIVGLFLATLSATDVWLPTLPPAAPIVAAGVLVLAAVLPLQRLTTTLFERAMPGITDSETYRRERSLLLYQAALEDAVVDGPLTASEQDTLVALQRRLGIPSREAVSVERRLFEGRSLSSYRA